MILQFTHFTTLTHDSLSLVKLWKCVVRKMNGDVITLSLVFFQLELCVVVVTVFGVVRAFFVVADETLFEHCVIRCTSFSSLMKYRPLLKMPWMAAKCLHKFHANCAPSLGFVLRHNSSMITMLFGVTFFKICSILFIWNWEIFLLKLKLALRMTFFVLYLHHECWQIFLNWIIKAHSTEHSIRYAELCTFGRYIAPQLNEIECFNLFDIFHTRKKKQQHKYLSHNLKYSNRF